MGSEREVACVYYKWEGECDAFIISGKANVQKVEKELSERHVRPARSIKLKKEASLPARILKDKRQRRLESVI